MDRSTIARVLVLASACAVALPAAAQRLAPGTTALSGGVSGYGQFEADLDGGGSVEMAGAIVTAQAYRQFSPAFGAGIALRYDYENWSFSGVRGLLGAEPWSELHRPTIALPLTWSPSPEYSFMATPTVQWSYEQGADLGDSLIAGALLSASRRFSPNLLLGLGVGVFDDLEETRAFPFVIVDWRIDDRWRLTNPFRAGPAGGAGLEIAYMVNDAWEVAGGGTWRNARFRLDDEGVAPGGIGEARSVPLYVRTTWQASRDVRLDFNVGVAVAGNLKLMDPDGRDLGDEDFDPAPFVGVTVRTRF